MLSGSRTRRRPALICRPAAPPEPLDAQRARRLFLSRDWRILLALRLGFEIANVTVPTRRTFHSSVSGALLSRSIVVLSICLLRSRLDAAIGDAAEAASLLLRRFDGGDGNRITLK